MSEVRRTCVSGQCWAAAALGAADQVRLRVCYVCVCLLLDWRESCEFCVL